MDFGWMMQTATMIGIGIIGYFLKTTMNDLKIRMKENENRVQDVEDKLNNLKSDLPFIYTTREDHAAAMNAVDRKITGMDKKLDKLLEYLTIERGGRRD
ncbi:hypothetical protein SAMN05660649_04282 [Desulfotomaculum arcticum]|uniref:Uncharacterized protein n=1 Tax=Desulfotruncus arcticus DSM 17038 TaxID=1121424 RepID=A0A1I2Y884_9FIRM|nr:hypothetical protein [Desulfotruncus arcticus]SFH21559.1 hypothetical protein SAMN05660649_04282 [Desulfotomaculum arcticum] [Desulfotruncus arcticus DSM 17038]